VVLDVTKKALDQLVTMRNAEGSAMAVDLKNNSKQMKKCLAQIQRRSKKLPSEYAQKIKKKIDELLAETKLHIDESVIAKEVAVFAERSDISEEIARLNSHLEQFELSCKSNGQAGRKLDFISQEMLREANTIASKAADCEIANLVVDIKCFIDRIKEQVQNIE